MEDAADPALQAAPDPNRSRELLSEIVCIEALMDWLKPATEPLAILNSYRLDEVLRRKRRLLQEIERNRAE